MAESRVVRRRSRGRGGRAVVGAQVEAAAAATELLEALVKELPKVEELLHLTGLEGRREQQHRLLQVELKRRQRSKSTNRT